jgi:hypothetical protein
VVPSALRTLSVVTLLSTVSGTVFLLNDHGPHRSDVASISTSGARFAEAALIIPAGAKTSAATGPSEDTTYRVQLREAARERVQAHQRALSQQRTRAREAKVKAAKAEMVRLAEAARRKAARAQSAKSARTVVHRRLRASSEVSRSSSRDPRSVARLMVADRGWGSSQFGCLVSLWNRESGWNLHASNPSSGAYGIPQALPGGKMAGAGPDWRNNAATQIRWGLGYIADRYGTPCGAWGHSQSTGWY